MSQLSNLYDKLQANAGEPPPPLEMGVKPSYGSLADFKGRCSMNTQEIQSLRRKTAQLVEKYL